MPPLLYLDKVLTKCCASACHQPSSIKTMLVKVYLFWALSTLDPCVCTEVAEKGTLYGLSLKYLRAAFMLVP